MLSLVSRATKQLRLLELILRLMLPPTLLPKYREFGRLHIPSQFVNCMLQH